MEMQSPSNMRCAEAGSWRAMARALRLGAAVVGLLGLIAACGSADNASSDSSGGAAGASASAGAAGAAAGATGGSAGASGGGAGGTDAGAAGAATGGAAGDASGGTGGAGGDGGATIGAPIDVPPTEQWVWVPINGTVCADGTEAGVGVNFTTRSRKLVIFFQGNGVCYDLKSCTVFQGLLTGMGSNPLDHMWWGDPNTNHLGIFDRNDASNPFRDDNFIVFPHCGVDGHTADKDSTYFPLKTVHQHGYANVSKALPRILGSFADATRVVVAGFSAGGIGAGANYHQIALAFEALGKPSPFMIDDAGPVLRAPYATALATKSLHNGWGLDKTIDTWCPECATQGYNTVYRKLQELHPGMRLAQLSSYQDQTATSLYALLNLDPLFLGPNMEAGLRDFQTWSAGFQSAVAPSAMRCFFYGGNRHGALVVDALSATPGLAQFLSDQLSGSPSWSSVVP